VAQIPFTRRYEARAYKYHHVSYLQLQKTSSTRHNPSPKNPQVKKLLPTRRMSHPLILMTFQPPLPATPNTISPLTQKPRQSLLRLSIKPPSGSRNLSSHAPRRTPSASPSPIPPPSQNNHSHRPPRPPFPFHAPHGPWRASRSSSHYGAPRALALVASGATNAERPTRGQKKREPGREPRRCSALRGSLRGGGGGRPGSGGGVCGRCGIGGLFCGEWFLL
jgi:hypothetical protein